MSDPRRRILHNPFYVLGLDVEASRAEIEREGQKLLGMLALGLSAALVYDTSLGPAPRTAEAVREAMAELRDPERRLIHELWARMPAAPDASPGVSPAASPAPGASPGASDAVHDAATSDAGASDEPQDPALAPWPGALARLGWRPSVRRQT